MAQIAIPVMPGMNTELDTKYAVELAGGDAILVHHRDTALPAGTTGVIVPGGFSYGDYLRAGAIARFAPVMEAVAAAADGGMPTLGICNGFQVLCEAGLLPGALARNAGARFICAEVHLRCETSGTPFSSTLRAGTVLSIPANHGEGCYTADPATLDELEANNQILFRYCDADGVVDPDDTDSNPNGSARAIAGVTNRAGNVAGMMPHPERACEAILGSADGMMILEAMLRA